MNLKLKIANYNNISYERGVLALSVLGVPVLYLKITDAKKDPNQRKKYIVISSRVHSGETHTAITFFSILK